MKRFSDDELLALLNNTESDRVEYKESFKGDVPKKARETICAFANDLPNHNEAGVLFIGAKDNGEPSGLDVSMLTFPLHLRQVIKPFFAH